MPSSNITGLTNLATPQPTMLLYAALSPFGVTDDRKVTANALLATITANISDISLQFDNGLGTATVAAAGKGKIRYNDTTKTFQASVDGGAYANLGGGMAIGGAVAAGTTGSVLFVAAGPVLAQDNANFFWDGTNHRLGIGTASPSVQLHIAASSGSAESRVQATSNQYAQLELISNTRQWNIGVGGNGTFQNGSLFLYDATRGGSKFNFFCAPATGHIGINLDPFNDPGATLFIAATDTNVIPLSVSNQGLGGASVECMLLRHEAEAGNNAAITTVATFRQEVFFNSPANGFGGRLAFPLQSPVALRDCVTFNWSWTDATDASRTSAIILQNVVNAGSLINRELIGVSKVLANNTVTTVENITIANNTVAGGIVDYAVEVFDGTDVQIQTGSFTYQATNKAATVANNTISFPTGYPVTATTAGTLTVTWTITAANPALLRINANSSLTPSAGFPRVTYTLRNLTSQAVTIQ